jgi:hypothetical protein
MFREMGYYWVKDNNVPKPEWRVAKWDGFRFFFIGTGWTIAGHHLEIDECRIVRDETKRGLGKSEKAKRNLHITAVVLGGDRMTDVAKLHGLSSNRVLQIVHNTLREKNKALYNKLVSLRADHGAPLLCDLQLCAAEFGFPLQAEVGDGQK